MENKNNPMNGMTLEKILVALEKEFGFKKLSTLVDIDCFIYNASIKSSLTFLRKTPWARTKVENLYKKTFLK